MKFSYQQQAAIDKRGASVILGAAAGSGKTTVMVNKIMGLLKDGACTAQELLVLTFTRAAASSMRSKLEEVLSLEAVNTDSQILHKAVRELPYAQISTFDSFCAALVRRYFFMLDIQADARVLDDNEEAQIINQVALQTLEEASKQCQRGEFDELHLLYDVLSKGKQDDGIIEVITKIFKHCRLYPEPEQRLRELCGKINVEQYKKSDEIFIKKRVVAGMDAVKQEERLVLIADTESNRKNAEINAANDAALYAKLNNAIKLEELLVPFEGKKQIRAGQFKQEFDPVINAVRDQLQHGEIIKDYANIDQDEIDMLNRIYAAVERLVSSYMVNMERELLARNVLTFDSAQHYAVRLMHLPQIAAELREGYKYIFVDEDQDSNRLQRYMLKALANDTQSNMFMVGDIKQSIYRFRNAEPELFLENIQDYNASDEDDLHCVMRLNNNFRSHSNILDCVNLIFKHNMKEDFYQLNYNKDEELIPPADTDEDKFWQNSSEFLQPTEVVLIKNDIKASADQERMAEARCVVKQVLENLGTPIPCKGGVRPAGFGDMVVLHRSANKRANVFIEAFAEAGIPFENMSSSSLFESYEVGCIIDVLSLIDNRLNDFAMFSAMRLYGFSFDKIIKLRAADPKSGFSSCIIGSSDPEAVAFISEIERLRFMCCCRPLWKVIWEIYETTGFYTRCASFDDGQERMENLRNFALLAQKYCSAQGLSLHAFLQLCKDGNMQEKLSDVEVSGNCVHMMTIHKSKGLEFPIVIVAGCGENIFKTGTTEKISISRDLGMSLKTKDYGDLCKFISGAVKRHEMELDRSEQLRNLYVAATRAVNKLIFTGIYEDNSYGFDCVRFNAKRYFDFILPPLLGHRDGSSLAERLEKIPVKGEDLGVWKWQMYNVSGCDPVKYEPEHSNEHKPPVQSVEEALENMRFEYHHKQATAIASKVGASEHEKSYELNAPNFLGKVSGASMGSAYHAILEHTDFAEHPSVTLERLVAQGTVSHEVADKLELKKLERFFQSPTGKELAGQRLIREAEFTMLQEKDGEKYLVQGIIDCFYVTDGGAVLVDFKSDDTSRGIDALTEKYRPQLEIYKMALKKCFGYECKRASIYYLDSQQRVDV